MAPINNTTQATVGKIRALTASTRPCPLNVLITRTWDVNITNQGTFDFIAMDTDGDQIHGLIPRKLVPDHEANMYENNVVHIKGFKVVEKRKKYYAPLRNQYNIEFTDHTKVEPVTEHLTFPPVTFQFVEFQDLKSNLQSVAYLSDIIGMFEQINDAKQLNPTNRIREIYLRNDKSEALKVTLWNGAINLLPPELGSEGSSPIVIVTSTKPTDFGGKISVNSTAGTKVYVDLDTPQVLEFRKRITTASPGKPERRLLASEMQLTIRDIRTSIAKKLTGYSLCRATVQKVYEDDGWKYSSCPKCRRNVNLSGEAYWCIQCEKWEPKPIDRFKLQLQICDKFGTLDVTAFDTAVSEMLDSTFKEIEDISKKPDTGDEEVSARLMAIVGKEFFFRIRIAKYNVENPESPLTVSSITPIEEPATKRPKTTQATRTQFPPTHSSMSAVSDCSVAQASNAGTSSQTAQSTPTNQ